MRTLPFAEPEDVGAAARAAAAVVAGGGVVLIPTESYYGLGADPMQATAVARVHDLKGRPDDLGLPVVCADWTQVEGLVTIPDAFRVKLGRLWPAALSVIAPCRVPIAAGRRGTLAVRLPGLATLRALLYLVGPLTATSANRHGEPPCTEVGAALARLAGAPDLVLDGGRLAGGAVSTIVDLSGEGGTVIRPGAVVWERPFSIEDWLPGES
ncbi:MAG: L-threonylcarbamoyladenylate synthase [Thermoanaerobaculales bacterium]|nr:L-threonylcarbamoyladenylate synthase [Thermoanaerobaculales bacterium]